MVAVSACFGLWAWSAEVQFAGAVSPLSPACWLGEKDKSRSSTSKVVQDVWEVYLETWCLVPLQVKDELHRFCYQQQSVDRAWVTWCKAAEEGLLTA